MLSHPGVLAGGILLRPMVPFEPDTLPDLTAPTSCSRQAVMTR